MARWRDTGITVEPVTGEALASALPALAALRIEVFRAYPYLYDGDLDYERDYVETFSRSPGAVVVLARHGARVIGASTGVPMTEAEADWQDPFREAGHAIERIFYCGESVLLPEYRGYGIGHAFFDHREAHARELGLGFSCFCGVIRPADHPARPEGYQPLDGFWRKRHYAPMSGIQARFAWKDIGDKAETEKQLQFWGRMLVD